MPQGEEADPLFVYSTRPIDNGPGVMLGNLKIEQILDHRLRVSFTVIAPDSLDLSEGFLRDLSILLLHRSRRPTCLAESPSGLLHCLLERDHEGDHEDPSGGLSVRWPKAEVR